MNFDLSEYLQCPNCSGNLLIGSSENRCLNCGSTFPSEEGIHILLPQRQIPEPKFYDDPAYHRYLEQIEKLHKIHYREGSLTGRIERQFKQRLASLIINPKPPVVDLGCGTGQGFSELGAEEDIIGVDNNLPLLRQCRRNFPKANLVCCDMRQSPLRPDKFENLFCVGTLEHVFHLEAFVESVEACLAPTGHFYVGIPTEGGMLWNLCRKLWTAPRNSRLLGLDYNAVIAKDHCNTVHTVHNVLKKFFEIEVMEQYPFGYGGFNLNLAMLYRLKKRT